MDEERQVIYLMKIFNSPFTMTFFGKKRGGTKSDYESVCNVSYKNKEFRSWINSLINDGFLFQVGMSENKTPLYSTTKKAILNKLKEIEYYISIIRKVGRYDYETL